MARVPDDLYCMICEQNPCGCGKAPKPQRKTAKETPPPIPAERPKPALEAMRQAALRPPPPPPPKPRIRLSVSEEDLTWIEGIRVAHRLLGATFIDLDDQKYFAAALATEDTPHLRAYLWRQRHQRRGDDQSRS